MFPPAYEVPVAFRMAIYMPATHSRWIRKFFWKKSPSRWRTYAIANYYWTMVREMSVNNFSFVDAVAEGADLTLFSLGTYRGPQGWREALKTWRETLDVNLELSEFINPTPEHRVVIGIRFIARGAASGIGIEDLNYLVLQIDDGMAVSGRFCRERREAFEAAGLSE